MSPAEREAIRARVEAATPGPWDSGAAGNCNIVRFDGDDVTGIAYASPRDADFIAHARTDIPALLAEVERLRKALGDALSLAMERDGETGWYERYKALADLLADGAPVAKDAPKSSERLKDGP